MKSLSQLDRTELIEFFDEFNLELPEGDKPTIKSLRAKLAWYGVDNDTYKQWKDKHDFEPAEEKYEDIAVNTVTGDLVIKMDRKNAIFTWGKYKFTNTHPYVPMKKEDAERLLAKKTGFHKATREEIQRYYND